jgi:hypothetical protein
MLQRDRQRQRERGTAGGGGVALTAEYLVVAGGGGGASAYGGGGAGGYRTANDFSFSLGTAYTVTVGAGAPADPAGGPLGSQGGDGGDSTFDAITSTGGGGGSSYDAATPGPLADGRDGGSGGGGGYTPAGSSGGSGNTPSTTPSQGNNGGSGSPSSPYYGAGGGGGAGAVGANGTSTNGGNGGEGLSSVITGSSVFRAGGGGGGNYTAANGGTGGAGGGGNAGSPGVAGAAGSVNTGGGGGGGHAGAAGVGAWTGGGAGGSGVVIIRVPSSVVAEFSAGVVYNYIPLDDFNVYEITAAGVSDTVTFSQGALATIDDSLRFNDDDTAYLSRTPASAGDRKTWTWSGWVKRGNLGGFQDIFTQASGAASDTQKFNLRFNTDKIYVDAYTFNFLVTTPIFRDPSSWYHVVCVFDTTQATANNRIRLYINGGEITNFDTRNNPTLNTDYGVNMATTHRIGSNSSALGQYLDGYLSDVYFIDGEALDPSRFGKQDADGVWQPISYTGTYGTNGFHLDFADNSTAAALGTDVSGNGNDWTPSGITTDDQVPDSPSNNFATLNPLAQGNSTTLSEGNLNFTSSTTYGLVSGTIGVKSGKWYWEALIGNTGTGNQVGLTNVNTSPDIYMGIGMDFGYGITGIIYGPNDTASQSGLTTSTTGDIIGVAMDLDAAEVKFYKNNSLIATVTSVDTSVDRFPAAADNSSGNQPDITANFGQDSSFAGNKTRQGNTDANGIGDFYYTPPSGYLALCTANLPAPVIADGKEHFQTALYTGNGTTQAIGGLEFSPDFVWIKRRSATSSHQLTDAVRGPTKYLFSDLTNAEETRTNQVTSFDSAGFTVGSHGAVNSSGNTFVAWNWNAGGSTVTNTDGTITSQVRANTDAGFSIVSYTSNGAAAIETIGHGLNTAPSVVITKNRSATSNWVTYHSALGNNAYILLNSSAAQASFTPYWSTSSTTWGQRQSGIGSNGDNIIAYCFAGVDGFSKFGSYTGKGYTDGPFVYTGFRPAFVMVKRTDASADWYMFDVKRNAYNALTAALFSNDSSNEITNSLYAQDFVANGWKIRSSQNQFNAFGGTYIYMAFAENPFKTARAR